MGVHEFHFPTHVVRVSFVYTEVEYADGIDLVELEVPSSLWRLLLNGEGAVEYASILKVFLFGLLHLYQEFFSLFVTAVYVEDGLPFCGVVTEVLHVEVVEGFDDLGPVKQRVEEADEQVFVGFCPE